MSRASRTSEMIWPFTHQSSLPLLSGRAFPEELAAIHVLASAAAVLRCMTRLPAASGVSGNNLVSAIEMLTIHFLLQASGFSAKTYSLHPLTHHSAASQAARETDFEEASV